MKFRFGLGAVIAMALLLVPATAVSAAPNQLELSASFADSDFCGTGQTIQVRSKAVIRLAEERPRFRPAKGRHKTVFINPANDAMVVLRSGGKLLVRKITNADGSFQVLMSFRGLPAVMRIGTDADYKHFRLRDPGYLLIVNHFSSEGKYLGSRLGMNEAAMAAENRAVSRFCRIAKHGLGL